MRGYYRHIKGLLIGFAYFDVPAGVAQWSDQIVHTLFRKYGTAKCDTIVGWHLGNQPTMLLVVSLFNNLQLHLCVSLKKCLLPEESTVVIHGGELE